MKVAHILDRAYGSRPVQTNSHFRIRVADVQRTRIVLLQAGKRTEATARSNPVLYEYLLGQGAAGAFDRGEGAIPVALLNVQEKIRYGLLGCRRAGAETGQRRS